MEERVFELNGFMVEEQIAPSVRIGYMKIRWRRVGTDVWFAGIYQLNPSTLGEVRRILRKRFSDRYGRCTTEK